MRPGALSTVARLTMLADAITALHATPASQRTDEQVLHTLVSISAEAFPDCDAVWVTVGHDERTPSPAQGDEGHRLAASLRLDIGPIETNGGPKTATLTVYREGHPFDAVDEALLRTLIAATTAAMDAARSKWQAEHLHRAIASRAEIEQAKGMIMAMRGDNADEAFHLLVEHSQHTNTKLASIAHDIVSAVTQNGKQAQHQVQASRSKITTSEETNILSQSFQGRADWLG